MQIDVLILNILFGTYCGYKTNDIAVKALFERQKYGPLTFGGFIIQQREEFAKSVGALVERDIINADTLKEQLAGEPFRLAFGQLMREVLQERLPQAAGEVTLTELPGAADTLFQLENFVTQILPGLSSALWQGIGEKLTLSDIIGEKQQEKLIEKIVQTALQALREQGLAANCLQSLYAERQQEAISDFLPETAATMFQKTLDERLNELLDLLTTQRQSALEDALASLYETAGFDGVVHTALQSVREKRLQDFCGAEDKEAARVITERLLALARSPEGLVIFSELARQLLLLLKEQSASLLDLLTPTFRDRILSALQARLPQLLDEVIDWFEERRENIETLLETAVDDVMSRNHGTRKWFKDLLNVNITANMGLFGRLVQYMSEQRVAFGAAAGVALTDKIIAMAERYSVSELVELAQRQGWLQEQQTADFLQRWTICFLEKEPEVVRRLVEQGLATQLSNFIAPEQLTGWEETLKKQFVQSSAMSLAQLDCRQWLQNQVDASWQDLYKRPLHLLIDETQWRELCPAAETWCLKMLESRREQLQAMLAGNLTEGWRTKPLPQGLPLLVWENALLYGENWLQQECAAFFSALPNQRVDILLRRFTDKLGEEDTVRDLLLTLVSDNLDRLLTGNVEKTVVGNLARVSETELSHMVQDFMGREMKAINLLGAVLGGAAGLAMGAFASYMPQQFGWSLAANTALQAGVGYGTNCQAIWMLFKPYRKISIPIVGDWLTPGVVVKNQARFAGSMGAFVGESLLAPDKLANDLVQREEGYIRLTRQRLRPYEMSALRSLLLEIGPVVGAGATTFIHQLLEQQALPATLATLATHRTLPDLRTLFPEQTLTDLLAAKRPLLTEGFIRAAQERRLSSQPVRTCLPNGATTWLDNKIEQLLSEGTGKAAAWLETPLRPDWLLQQAAGRLESVLDRPLATLLSETKTAELSAGMTRLLIQKLQTPAITMQLQTGLSDWLATALSPEKTLREVAGGKPFQGLLSLLPIVLDKAVGLLQGSLANDRERIKARLLAEYREHTNWLERTLQGGEEIIPETVDYLIDERLPRYFAEEGTTLLPTIEAFLHHKIGPLTLREAGMQPNVAGVERMLTSLAADTRLPVVIGRLTDVTFRSLLTSTPRSFIYTVGLPHCAATLQCLRPELAQASRQAGDSLRRQQAPVVQTLMPLARAMTDEFIWNRPLAAWLKNVGEEEAGVAVARVADRLFESAGVQVALTEWSQQTLAALSGRSAAVLLDEKMLASDLTASIDKLLADDGWLQTFGGGVTQAAGQLADQVEQMLAPELRQTVAGFVSEALVRGLQGQLSSLLTAVHFPEVTEKRVKAMDPAEIHAMFQSFAEPSFRQIKRYGLAGGVLGLLATLVQHLFFGG